jgi:hypothetical protein
MSLDADGFDRSVLLPPELKITHVREAIEHVEDRTAELVDIYFEQANVFSAIFGILGIQALHALSHTRNTSIRMLPNSDFPISHCEESSILRPSKRWSRRVRPELGHCNRITITPDGTSCGVTLLT